MENKRRAPGAATPDTQRKVANSPKTSALPQDSQASRRERKALSDAAKAKGPPRLFMLTDDLPERWDLPFCRKTDGEGDYWGVADYWAVTPSGDDAKDYERGFEWGREAVAFTDQTDDSPQALVFVLRDMVEKGRFGHLEAGFCDAVATAALLYHNSLRHGWFEINHINTRFGKPIVYPCREKPKRLPFVRTKLSWDA